jgi:hypothetical protein
MPLQLENREEVNYIENDEWIIHVVIHWALWVARIWHYYFRQWCVADLSGDEYVFDIHILLCGFNG